MKSRMFAVIVFAGVSGAMAAAHDQQRLLRGGAVLASNLRPDLVARTFANVIDEWKSQASDFADCNAKNGAGCSDTSEKFLKSCWTVTMSMVSGSNGDRDVVKDYMGDICGQQVLTGWRRERCIAMKDEVEKSMIDNNYENRLNFDAVKTCHALWTQLVDGERERKETEAKEVRELAEKAKEYAKKQAQEEELKMKAEKQAEEQAKKKAAEDAKKALEEAKRKEAEAKKLIAAKKAEEDKIKLKQAAARMAAKKAEAEEAAQAAQKKMEEAKAAEEEQRKLLTKSNLTEDLEHNATDKMRASQAENNTAKKSNATQAEEVASATDKAKGDSPEASTSVADSLAKTTNKLKEAAAQAAKKIFGAA